MLPNTNLEIIEKLYLIENAMRELIVDEMTKVEGTRWYVKRLPGDILKKYEDGLKSERNISWIQSVPHHPIYYVDFPDLKKIVERNDNWQTSFAKIFSRKDILSSTLSELESIRNKIAHNRKASTKDVEIVKSAYVKLSDAIGNEYFAQLVEKCTCADDITERIRQLRSESEVAYNICTNYQPLNTLQNWRSVQNEWWFSESYIGQPLGGIKTFFNAMEDYAKLPRSMGTGHIIESWVKAKTVDKLYEISIQEFSSLLLEVL